MFIGKFVYFPSFLYFLNTIHLTFSLILFSLFIYSYTLLIPFYSNLASLFSSFYPPSFIVAIFLVPFLYTHSSPPSFALATTLSLPPFVSPKPEKVEKNLISYARIKGQTILPLWLLHTHKNANTSTNVHILHSHIDTHTNTRMKIRETRLTLTL